MNQIFHGNCVDVLAKLPAEWADLVITSPPYDNQRDYNGYDFNCLDIVKALYRSTKQGGVAVWIVGDAVEKGSETGTSFRQALMFIDNGWRLHDTMIYEKNTSSFPARHDGNRYTQIFEYMFIFSKGKPKTANLIKDKKNSWFGYKNWGKKTERGKDGILREKKDIKPVPPTSPRNNIWRYVPFFEDNDNSGPIRRYVVGGNFGQKDKIAYEHPACVDDKTDCLTINGWKKYDELNIGDDILSYNIEKDCLEWQKVEDITIYNHDDIAYSVNGRHLSILMNANHRNVIMSVNNKIYIKKAYELKKSDKILCSARMKSNLIKPINKDEASLLGWFLSEGHFGERSVNFSQSISKNLEYVNEIIELLDRLKVNYSMRKRERLYAYDDIKVKHYKLEDENYLKKLGINYELKKEACFCIKKGIHKNLIMGLCHEARQKIMPSNILMWDIEILESFFDTFVKGDGHRRTNSDGFMIRQTDEHFLHTFQAIGILLGYNTHLSLSLNNRYVGFDNKKTKLLRNSRNSILTKIPYKGIMWCPKVSNNQTFVARRNNRTFITGNTFPEHLAYDHLQTWSNEGDVVLDPMAGSSTTGVAALECKRNYIGIEISKEYCILSHNRTKLPVIKI